MMLGDYLNDTSDENNIRVYDDVVKSCGVRTAFVYGVILKRMILPGSLSCVMSNVDVTRVMKISVNTVRKAIGRLETAGLIRCDVRVYHVLTGDRRS